MTLVERDPKSRESLTEAYLEGDLGYADVCICICGGTPQHFLTEHKYCRSFLLSMELWAAVFGHPHPAIQHVEPDRSRWPRQRLSTRAESAVTALFWLSQSPHSAEFADDVHSLRPRLFALAQEHAQPPYTDAQPGA